MIDYSDADNAEILFSRQVEEIESVLEKTTSTLSKLLAIESPSIRQSEAIEIAESNISVISMVLSVKRLHRLHNDVLLDGWSNETCVKFMEIRESKTVIMSYSQYVWVGLSHIQAQELERFTDKASSEIGYIFVPHPSGMCFYDQCAHLKSIHVDASQNLYTEVSKARMIMESRVDIEHERYFGIIASYPNSDKKLDRHHIIFDTMNPNMVFHYINPNQHSSPDIARVWEDVKQLCESIALNSGFEATMIMEKA